MGRIILWMSISVDGFIEGPGRDITWHRVDEPLHQHFNDELRRMSAFISGRTTYELMEAFWPSAGDDPDSPPTMVEFAEIWRTTPKVVYSTTLDVDDPMTTVEREVTVESVTRLKAEADGDMTLGGAALAATFMRLDLIDAYRIYVHPVVVGGGTPLFPGGLTNDLDLVQSRVFGNGVVLLRYRPSSGRPAA